MNNSYETFELEMSGEKIKSLLDFLSNNRGYLETLIQNNPKIIEDINKIITDINSINNITTIDGGTY